MSQHYDIVVVGGGCLGSGCAISLARELSNRENSKVCLIEKAVIGAGLSSRHSAIVRSANASATAARLARRSTKLWMNLKDVWGVSTPWQLSGAIWIGHINNTAAGQSSWNCLAEAMSENEIDFQSIDKNRAEELTSGHMRLSSDELYFYEPNVLQLEATGVIQTLQEAVKLNNVEVKEHTRVISINVDVYGKISGVETDRGIITCDFVVNAAGAWSPRIFDHLGMHIPIALEPVYAANWLISANDLPENLPIIADFINQAYFRRWRGSILHMHQPRNRVKSEISATFSHSYMNPLGADIIYDASNFAVTYTQLNHYNEKVRDRFPSIGAPLYAGGYVSYFDITPDLKFIIGRDGKISNLIHCLGGGQALKYAPVFGELVKDVILEKKNCEIDLKEFSIERFYGKSINDLWSQNDNHLNPHSL